MKRTSSISMAMALAFAIMLGIAGIADAQSSTGHQNMSPDQYKAMQDAYAEFDKRTEPLRQQLHARQAELDALHSRGTPRDDPKVQSLIKDIEDLDGKLYAAHDNLRKQLNDKGVPAHGGVGHGYGWPAMGMMGPGYRGAMMGRDMMRYSDCGCCCW